MKRHLLNLLTLASLLTWVAVVALWVGSHFWLHLVRLNFSSVAGGPRTETRIYSVRGAIVYERARAWCVPPHPSSAPEDDGFRGIDIATWRVDEAMPGPTILSFDHQWSEQAIGCAGGGRQTIRLREVQVPYWAPAMAAAVLPARWLLTTMRRRRHLAAGLCPRCDYDLRMTPERCPECGNTP